MKIDTSSPRIPLNRLKHPLKVKSSPPVGEDSVGKKPETAFADVFERELLQEGAERFESWLKRLQVK